MPIPPQVTDIQEPFNCVTATAASATAVTATVSAVATVRQVCYWIGVSVSGAATGTGVTLSLIDGSTTILDLDLAVAVGVPYVLSIPNGITGTPGNAMSVTLSAGATGCVGKVTLGYDSFVV